MTIWGRIEQGKVVELIDYDPKDRYHPDLVWEVVPDGTVQGATRGASGEWENPEVPEDNQPAPGPGDEPAPSPVDTSKSNDEAGPEQQPEPVPGPDEDFGEDDENDEVTDGTETR